MPGTRILLIANAIAVSHALAGCSALMLDRSESDNAPPAPQTLQFLSEPAGAVARTAQGQMCQTPCTLILPVESQSVIFTKNGFVAQTIQITADQPPPEHSFFSKRPPPALKPNPVKAVLEVALSPLPLPTVQPAPPPARPAPPPSNAVPWFPS